jgi:hypothetical protein
MQAQIRIYTINKGKLDNFSKHCKEETKPLHDKVGWPIVATWVNRPQNEFIWIRTYEDAADLEAKSKALREARRGRDHIRHDGREDGSPRCGNGLSANQHSFMRPPASCASV